MIQCISENIYTTLCTHGENMAAETKWLRLMLFIGDSILIK